MYRVLFLFFVGVVLATPQINNIKAAKTCDTKTCVAPDCRCSSTSAPLDTDITEIPQFVFLTFDDAIQKLNHDTYKSLFDNRVNPDGCPISVTFFMSHDYTDYSQVYDLYKNHHEIALHSITHLPSTDYWKNITDDLLNQEFGDEKLIIEKFANLPKGAIKGMRVPYLQLSGDKTFQVGKDLGLLYDCSWPTQTYRKPGLWPYTLDYKSTQDCSIGPCPSDSIPGMWVVPMIDWTDQANVVCSMVDACVNIPDDPDELFNWFVDNFNVQYKGNRAPFGFFVHNAYFNVNPNHLTAYRKFVDYLQGLNDVYLVSPSQAIEWIKNPKPLSSGDWNTCFDIEDLGCKVKTCHVKKGDEDRYMTICGDCPQVYPWMGNPNGDA